MSSNNPLGSTSVSDMFLNAGNLDKALNGNQDSWIDRFGVERVSWSYIEKVTKTGELSKQAREALRRSYAEAGLNMVDGSFEKGGILVNANDVLLHEATGKCYSGNAGTVAPGTLPTAGGFQSRDEYISFYITPEMYGARGLPYDDTTALRDAMQAAVDINKPLLLLKSYGHKGQVTAMPKKHGDRLVIYGNGNTLQRLEWSNTDWWGICFYRNWHDTTPLYKNTSFIVRDLNVDCGFNESNFNWDAPTSAKPGVSTASMATAAENVVMHNVQISNSQRYGLACIWPKFVEIKNFRTVNLGGKAYESGDHDSYSDPLLLRMIQGGGKIDIDGFNAVGIGYPTSPMSRIGISAQDCTGTFTFSLRDAEIFGFERTLHFEHMDYYYTVNIDALDSKGTFCGVHVTRGAGTINVQPSINIENSQITVCKNTFYKPGMFEFSEAIAGWVRDARRSDEDASLGAVFNISNTKLNIGAGLDGIVYPVPWGGNVNLSNCKINYNNTNSVKQSGYTRIENSVITGLGTSGEYFFPWNPTTHQVTIELDNCWLELSPLADKTKSAKFHHSFGLVKGPYDNVKNCKIRGHIKLPINESVDSGNHFLFLANNDLDAASQVGSLSLTTENTGEFPPRGCVAQVGSEVIPASKTANNFVKGGYVVASAGLKLRDIMTGLRTGIYTLVVRPTTGSSSIAMAVVSPMDPGYGKCLQVIKVLSPTVFSSLTPERFGRDQTLDGLKIEFDTTNILWYKNPTDGTNVVNIAWGLYAGNISADIYKG
ncbi:hypothetical protein CF8_0160 [Aeromonas phage CF8]|nr:hypothetical protein CF8_0160 [Aeromonas phage CF8]